MIQSIVPRNGRKKRASRHLESRTSKWLIVCGALETELNYINELIIRVNKFNPKDKKIRYEIKPISLDPKNLVDKIRREIIICSEQLDVKFSKTFVVFDKDSFENDDYNRAIEMCENNGYIALYSNECIELWFYLHFVYNDVALSRFDLIEKIDNLFKKKISESYEKSDKYIFEKLFENGNILNALVRSKKLKENYSGNNTSLAKTNPITNMDVLLDEIEFHQKEFGLPSIYEIFKKNKKVK